MTHSRDLGPGETAASCGCTAIGCASLVIGFLVIAGAFFKGAVWVFDLLVGLVL